MFFLGGWDCFFFGGDARGPAHYATPHSRALFDISAF